jgi:hypothetical protein
MSLLRTALINTSRDKTVNKIGFFIKKILRKLQNRFAFGMLKIKMIGFIAFQLKTASMTDLLAASITSFP